MIQYFIGNLWLVWLIASIAFLLLELTNGDFYIICFALGALASIVCAAVGAPFWAQVLVWATASVLCILFVRPSLVKRLHGAVKERKSNADALIGKQGRVVETISANGFGYVRIDGDEWRSVAADGMEIPKDALVEVVARESIVLTVKLINQNS